MKKKILVTFKVHGTQATAFLTCEDHRSLEIDSCDYNDVRCVTQAHIVVAQVANTFDVEVEDVDVIIEEPNSYTVDKVKEMANYIKSCVSSYSIPVNHLNA